jgi:hypothetical protein
MGVCIIYFGYSHIEGKYVTWDDKIKSNPQDRYTTQDTFEYGNPDIYDKTS